MTIAYGNKHQWRVVMKLDDKIVADEFICDDSHASFWKRIESRDLSIPWVCHDHLEISYIPKDMRHA